MRIFKSLVASIFLLAVTGCASLGSGDEYAELSPKEFYTEAKSALDSGNYEQAIMLYSKLEARFPYGPYAQQAQLETAYAYYKSGEPASAVGAADRFIKLHPRHQHVDYAYYIRGLASFTDGGGVFDRLFDQTPSDRDPGGARESFNHFRELVSRFPDSRYSQDAIKRMTYLRNNLAHYEIHVADHYLSRSAWLAAVNRAKYVTEYYAGSTALPDALAIMVEAYTQMGMTDLASDARRVLELNYPGFERGRPVAVPAAAAADREPAAR